MNEDIFYFDLNGNIKNKKRISLQDWDKTKEYSLRENLSKEIEPIQVLKKLNEYFKFLFQLAKNVLPSGIIIELFVSEIIYPLGFREPYKFIEWHYYPNTKQSIDKCNKPIKKNDMYYLGRVKNI